jgi:predicted nucleotidyltransferase
MSTVLNYHGLGISEDKIVDFCRRWKIMEFALFGSILRDDFGPDSDVDVLVAFGSDAEWSLLDHIQMEQELANLFGRGVDLVSRRAVDQSENWIRRKHILGNARVVYASR